MRKKGKENCPNEHSIQKKKSMEHSSEENIYQMQQQQQPRVNPKLGWDCGSFSGNGDQIPKKILAKKKN